MEDYQNMSANNGKLVRLDIVAGFLFIVMLLGPLAVAPLHHDGGAPVVRLNK